VWYANALDPLNYQLGATTPGFVYKTTVNHLYRASLYFIKVRAVNQVGPGHMSSSLNIRTLDAKPVAPGKPVKSVATDPLVPASNGATSSTVSFRFEIPTDMGGIPVVNYKVYLWESACPAGYPNSGTCTYDANAGRWDDGTVLDAGLGKPGGQLATVNSSMIQAQLASGDIVKHDGPASAQGVNSIMYFDKYMTVTYLRLKKGFFYRCKVMASNGGYGLMSLVSDPVQTLKVPEADVTVRLMYETSVIFGVGPNDALDDGKTQAALNASFIQEWAHQLKLPENRFNVISMTGSSVYRLGSQLHFVLMKFSFLAESASTRETMEAHVASLQKLVTTKGSAIHTGGMVNRKLDFGYMLVDWGLATGPAPYVWVMPGSGVPSVRTAPRICAELSDLWLPPALFHTPLLFADTRCCMPLSCPALLSPPPIVHGVTLSHPDGCSSQNRLHAAGSVALGTIFFMAFPIYMATWMPFYWAKRAEGLNTGEVIELTLFMWLTVILVYVNHLSKLYDKWQRSDNGKWWIAKCCCLYYLIWPKKEIRPEDIDFMTGMPYGFDPKYFPEGMPPEAMKKYEDNVRKQREALMAD